MKKLYSKVLNFSVLKKEKLDKYLIYLKKYLENHLNSNNFNGFAISISGGLDSSFLALFLEKYFPNKVYFFFQPSKTTTQLSYDSINKLLKIINKKNFFLISVEKTKNLIVKEFAKCNLILNSEAKANIYPRLRMVNIYTLAKQLNLLVVGTSNRCEWELGYFTKYGDGAADIYPIIFLSKSEILYYSIKYKVPNIILQRAPTAEIFQMQSDEKEFGFTYLDLENYLENNLTDPLILKKIKSIKEKNNHKKKLNFPLKLGL